MKSNVLLQSESRELLGRNISVMSKDGFVCITEVMDVLSQKRAAMGLEPKRLDHLMSTSSFQEKMNALIKELNINELICTVRYRTLKDNSLNISKLTDLKKYGMAYRRGKGKDQKWFVNPYFFVMIALELDPEIYAKVILWLTDNFIENRNIAGEAYIKMCKSVSSLIKNKSELSDKIKIVAKAINFIVFNKHEDGIRNFATKNELNEIISIENAVGAIIDGEFVHSFEELRMYLGKEWKKRWGNPIMTLK